MEDVREGSEWKANLDCLPRLGPYVSLNPGLHKAAIHGHDRAVDNFYSLVGHNTQ